LLPVVLYRFLRDIHPPYASVATQALHGGSTSASGVQNMKVKACRLLKVTFQHV